MFISKLNLKQYRNYELQEVNLCENVNIFFGKNAQGKTNLLEAIYLLSLGKSPKSVKDKELIRWEQNRSYICGNIVKRYGEEKVEIILDRKDNKRVAINGLPISKLGELMGVMVTVLFSPDEMGIIKSSPQERRRFMDITLCQLSKTYFYTLNRYNKILAQRNRLLKSGDINGDVLDVWNMQLVNEGSKIIKSRKGYIALLNEQAKKTHAFLTDNAEHLELKYEGIAGDSLEEIKENFTQALIETRDRDIIQGFTKVGLQTDDIEIKSNDIDVRKFGSQGQQRTTALTLKLSELEIIKNEIGEYPVLLLDDVFSELDMDRQRKLLELIKNYQTIITCAIMDENLFRDCQNAKIFQVENGKIITEN